MKKWSPTECDNGKKWLDENPKKISVLKYVAIFKDRLFSAGQMAKRKLRSPKAK